MMDILLQTTHGQRDKEDDTPRGRIKSIYTSEPLTSTKVKLKTIFPFCLEVASKQ